MIAYCQYDPAFSLESGRGALKLLLPTAGGYVNYNLVHSVRADRGCDTWRLGQAFFCGPSFETVEALTPHGAEWDMALRLSGRADFIGGYAHGDESFTDLSVMLDGKAVDPTSLSDQTPFRELVVTVKSVGYDPDDSVTAALKHEKRYVVSTEQITLYQRVEWLGCYTLGSSYMAMMPPLKTLTDAFYTGADPTPRDAESNYGATPGATAAVVYGKASGVTYSMSAPETPPLAGGGKFLLTDNNGGKYNKMYFVLCNGAEAAEGDVWTTTTVYTITKK